MCGVTGYLGHPGGRRSVSRRPLRGRRCQARLLQPRLGHPSFVTCPQGANHPAHHLTIDPNWMLATRWQRVAWAQSDS